MPGGDIKGNAAPGQRRAQNRISAFLDAQAAELGAARNTLLAYGRDLVDFSDWLTGRVRIFCRSRARGSRIT